MVSLNWRRRRRTPSSMSASAIASSVGGGLRAGGTPQSISGLQVAVGTSEQQSLTARAYHANAKPRAYHANAKPLPSIPLASLWDPSSTVGAVCHWCHWPLVVPFAASSSMRPAAHLGGGVAGGGGVGDGGGGGGAGGSGGTPGLGGGSGGGGGKSGFGDGGGGGGVGGDGGHGVVVHAMARSYPQLPSQHDDSSSIVHSRHPWAVHSAAASKYDALPSMIYGGMVSGRTPPCVSARHTDPPHTPLSVQQRTAATCIESELQREEEPMTLSVEQASTSITASVAGLTGAARELIMSIWNTAKIRARGHSPITSALASLGQGRRFRAKATFGPKKHWSGDRLWDRLNMGCDWTHSAEDRLQLDQGPFHHCGQHLIWCPHCARTGPRPQRQSPLNSAMRGECMRHTAGVLTKCNHSRTRRTSGGRPCGDNG